MRKLLFMMLAVCALASCSKDNDEGDKGVTVTGGDQTQNVYADDTSGQGGVTFTTTGAWTSSITDDRVAAQSISKTSAPDWVSIDPASGNKAGNYTINITLNPNFSGTKRTATIKILCNGTTITITLTQNSETEQGEVPKNYVTEINLNKTELTLERETSEDLVATVLPETATNKNVIWASSDAEVATVSDGKVTAISSGTAEITATTEDGEKVAKCIVTVVNQLPTGAGTFTYKYNDGSRTETIDVVYVADNGSIRFNSGDELYLEYRTASEKLEAMTYTFEDRGPIGTWYCQKGHFDNMQYYCDGGTTTVSISGDIYTITLNWEVSNIDKRGKITGTYVGKIVNL